MKKRIYFIKTTNNLYRAFDKTFKDFGTETEVYQGSPEKMIEKLEKEGHSNLQIMYLEFSEAELIATIRKRKIDDIV